jgi:hypothetical protein
VKKETLKVIDDGIHENVLLYAISSSSSDIRICQTLNRILGINLVLADNLEIIKRKTNIGFRQFTYESHEDIEKFILVVNRNAGNVLFHELKTIDYVLLILTESPKGIIETSIRKLKDLPEISAIYKVDHKLLKSFSQILYS